MVIKIDGIDGCGKTTLIKELIKKFPNNAISTIEFGTNYDEKIILNKKQYSISNIIREIALDDSLDVDDTERQALFSIISRRNNRLVIPVLETKYKYVFIDRSGLSNYAYGLPLNKDFKFIYKIIVDSIEQYDILIWIDTPIDICFNRINGREKDVVEKKGIKYLYKVYINYLNLFEDFLKAKKSIYRIDGSKSLENNVNEVYSIIMGN